MNYEVKNIKCHTDGKKIDLPKIIQINLFSTRKRDYPKQSFG